MFSTPNNNEEKEQIKNQKTNPIPKITINLQVFDDPESKYEGKPLIKPKIPYQYKVKTF